MRISCTLVPVALTGARCQATTGTCGLVRPWGPARPSAEALSIPGWGHPSLLPTVQWRGWHSACLVSLPAHLHALYLPVS